MIRASPFSEASVKLRAFVVPDANLACTQPIISVRVVLADLRAASERASKQAKRQQVCGRKRERVFSRLRARATYQERADRCDELSRSIVSMGTKLSLTLSKVTPVPSVCGVDG